MDALVHTMQASGRDALRDGLVREPERHELAGRDDAVLRRGQILMQQKFQVLEVFMVVAIIYLAMTTCWDFVQRRIEAYYGKAYGTAADKQLARDDH